MLLLSVMIIGVSQRPGDRPETSLEREFTLPIGREVTLSGTGLVISFKSVVEDSRCPEGVDCIWSGNAKVEIGVSRPGVEPGKLLLNTHLAPQSGSYSSYKISLLALNPYPRSGETINPEKYQVKLMISGK